MDGSDKQLNRECSLFCNDGKHVIIGAAILISDEQRPHFYELYTNNEFISTVRRHYNLKFIKKIIFTFYFRQQIVHLKTTPYTSSI